MEPRSRDKNHQQAEDTEALKTLGLARGITVSDFAHQHKSP
jgi:hypothetical protein